MDMTVTRSAAALFLVAMTKAIEALAMVTEVVLEASMETMNSAANMKIQPMSVVTMKSKVILEMWFMSDLRESV